MVCKRFSSPRYLGALCDFRSSRGAKVYEIFWTKAGRVVKNVKSAKMYRNASPIPRPLAPQLSLEIPRKTLVRGRTSISPSGSFLKKWKLSRRPGRLYQSGDQAYQVLAHNSRICF